MTDLNLAFDQVLKHHHQVKGMFHRHLGLAWTHLASVQHYLMNVTGLPPGTWRQREVRHCKIEADRAREELDFCRASLEPLIHQGSPPEAEVRLYDEAHTEHQHLMQVIDQLDQPVI